MDELRQATSDLTIEWARLLAPHFGPAGSMDLDLIDWPNAEGPSFYNQYSHFLFLQLATGEVPGATADEKKDYLRLALAKPPGTRSRSRTRSTTRRITREAKTGGGTSASGSSITSCVRLS